jgi:hypothetical protein
LPATALPSQPRARKAKAVTEEEGVGVSSLVEVVAEVVAEEEQEWLPEKETATTVDRPAI